MSQELFKAESLSFQYSEKSPFQLKTGAFSILKNQTIAIIGPSGGGKSTLLRLIEGSLPKPDQQVLKNSKSSLIYQDLRLVNEKSALENTLMGALGRSQAYQFTFTKQFVVEALELLGELGLASYVDQPVSMLSGGQRQRVAIARALMSQPEILLADEPFSHLDHATAMETYHLLKKLQSKREFAIVITIHSNELEDFSFDQIWKVQAGELLTDDFDQKESIQEFDAFQKNHWVEILILSILFIGFLLSALNLPTTGFNSDNAFSELKTFFSQLLFHTQAELAQVEWAYLLKRLGLTIQMAFVGTAIGFFISLPFSFFAAEGVAPSWVHIPLRSFFMVIRSIPSLVWALFFVAVLGLGPMSGVAALSVYSVGYFTKFLYEGIEDLEIKPFQALRQLGASRFQATIFALLPSSRPLIVSSLIFMLEYNVRAASLLGLVGAGGIGQDLLYSIEWRDFATVFSILLLLICVVFVFDQISAYVRRYYKRLRGI